MRLIRVLRAKICQVCGGYASNGYMCARCMRGGK